MSATTEARAVCPRTWGDQKIVLRGISPELYDELSRALDEQHVRLAYNQGVLELVSPSLLHEIGKRRFGRFVAVLTEEVGLPCIELGSTTWRTPLADRGIESDECFLLDPAKLDTVTAIYAERPKLNDAADYPKPDLAIEIDIRSGAVDRGAIYAALGVPEVWRDDGETLVFDVLGPDGRSQPQPTSPSLRVTPAEVLGWVNAEERDFTRWARALRAWVREQVVPRF